MPNAVVSHYRLLNQLGSGGMGVVYRAEDTALGRAVALKFLPAAISRDPKRLERLRYEARTASALNHPNICTIYEVAEDQGELFIAMEYVAGRPLSELIRKHGMPIETILRYAQQIAAALEHAHEHGIVHRDLKPVNVVVTPSGDAKILDFGLAKRTDTEVPRKTTAVISTDSSIGLTGTLPYMSPEQLEGGEAGPRSDLWSFGVMLYEMAAGQRPFQGENLYRMCSAILQEPAPPLPEHVPKGLASVIRRCLEKEPTRRYQRASELRAALQALESSIAIDTRRSDSERSRWRMQWAIPLVAFALLLLGLWIGFGWRNAGRPNAAMNVALQPMQLAVLPPTGGAQPEEAAFDNGLVETLTSRLTELTSKHSFAVIPASEVRARKVSTVEEAHAEFGVNLGLLVSVQYAAGQRRVTYALVEARSHRQLRGGTITAPKDDPFTLQDRVSESVAQALELQLGPEEKNVFQAHGTTEPAAYDFYLQGRGYLQDYGKQENIENAITVFRRALEKDPGFAAAYAGLGEAYWQKFALSHENDLVEQAKRACQEANQRDPNLSEAHTCLGRVAQGTGEYQQAADEYRRASNIEPTSDSAAGGLARAYESLGHLDDSEQTYKAAIALRPNYWVGYSQLGTFYLRHGKLDEAAQMYEQVVSLVPDSFIGYTNLGITRVQQGDYKGAIEPLKRSVEIRKTGEATSNLGMAYFQQKQFSEAAKYFEEATALDPHNYELWGNLGDAYYWAPGMREHAAGAYRKALQLGEEQRKINPRNANMLAYLAGYHAMLGEARAAHENVAAALQAMPQDPEVLYYAGLVYAQLKENEKSIDALKRSIAAGYPVSAIRDTPNFSVLENDPRYRALVSTEKSKAGRGGQ